MTSSGAEATGSEFRHVVDALRCEARIQFGRCGLYHDHDGEHAYGEIVSRKPWRDRVWRWAHGGEPHIEDPAPRLPWCSLHHD